MAHQAALKEVAAAKLRRLLAYNMSFRSTDVQIGDAVLFYRAMNRKSAPRWRGLTKIADIDGAGVAVEFPPQTSKVALYCVRKKVGEKDVEDVDQNRPPVQPRTTEPASRENSTLRNEGDEMEVGKEKVGAIPCTGAGLTVVVGAGTLLAPTLSSTSCAGVPLWPKLRAVSVTRGGSDPE